MAKLMAIEIGEKPFAQGIAEAEKCAWVCEHYADNAEPFLSPEIVPTGRVEKLRDVSTARGSSCGDAIGIFRSGKSFRAAAPPLMAGNAVGAEACVERLRLRAGD